MRSHFRSPLAPPLRRARPVDRWTRECLRAEAWVGAGHPLTVALWATRRVVDQVVVIAAVQLVGSALVVAGDGPALLIAASAVQCWLGFRLLLLAESRRVACLNLLVEGCGFCEVAALARAQRRLADPRRRAALAGSIEQLVETATRPRRACPYVSVRVIRAVAPELREVAQLVRAVEPPLAGVAFVERLMGYGTSAVYGHATEPLRVELKRARYLLLRQG